MQIIKDYVFSFSKNNRPVAKVKDGEVLLFKTEDCFGNQIQKEGDLVTEIDFTHTNPATGPVYVEGAEPGDTLAVDILKIDVADKGIISTLEGYGALWNSCELRTKIVDVKDGYIQFNEVKVPCNPMIGVIGTAPDGEDVPSGYSFNGGGNMDSRIITAGTTVYFPVRVEGALLSMGDVHAAMGDGEVCETGVEIVADITVRVRIIKNFKLNWPVTETTECWFVNTNGKNCDIAIQRGYEELQRLIMDAYGWDATDACMYISIAGRLESNQSVLDINETDEEGDTFRVGIPKTSQKPRLIPSK